MRHNLFPISALVVLAIAISVSAQRPAATPAPNTPTRPAPTQTPTATAPVADAALPTSKIALISTGLFLDPKEGIAKFSSTLTKLNGEFQKVKDDITQMQTRAQALETEINKLREAPAGTPIDQRSLQTKIDQLEQLKKDAQRKAEDAQGSYDRRRQELFAPVEEEIRRALEAFAKARGINVIIDAAQAPLLYADRSLDITRAFIADFNSKNPVTATITPP
ncbi:MAG TPA: OmpH family outer membrane protein [Pyrinomonadaceae bacterium]|jgi:Skp family chaperone for outer membrane proteins|nr:OmpH family outer membrane protein [Pyrinomonadaceae bacterium]